LQLRADDVATTTKFDLHRSVTGLAQRRHVAWVIRADRPRPPTRRTTAGALAAATWLRQRGSGAPAAMPWSVAIALDVAPGPAPERFDEAKATRFHLDVDSDGWGVFVCHGGRSSWIRVVDLPFVHRRDELTLVGIMPALKDIGVLVRGVERWNAVRFQRHRASVRTNLPAAELAIRRWLESI
jgi:hypothetical protein